MSKGRVWVEVNEAEGEVYVKEGENVILARTKSINVARRIRDALNAPDTLVGQTVEVNATESGCSCATCRENPPATKLVRGTVMALTRYCNGMPAFVLRLEDNRLETFLVDGARIVEPVTKPAESWDP